MVGRSLTEEEWQERARLVAALDPREADPPRIDSNHFR